MIIHLGLYHDDIYHETADVVEAVSRLPRHIQDERMFRIQKALQLSLVKNILPKSEWVTFEDVSILLIMKYGDHYLYF